VRKKKMEAATFAKVGHAAASASGWEAVAAAMPTSTTSRPSCRTYGGVVV
jgi:hypothetical protein